MTPRPEPITHVSLFTGIGGLDLAAEWAGFETILQVERDPYCLRVLEKHWPAVKRITDIREVNHGSIDRPVDVVSGGFPCQPFSTASHGRRVAEDLSGELVRCTKIIKPKYAVGENVNEEIIRSVAKQFRLIGYRATVRNNSAFSCGSDHIRYRWWAIAYPNDESEFLSTLDAEMALLQEIQNNMWYAKNMARAFRGPYGIPHRVDRLRALGNAVVPQQAYPIFRAIAETL